MNSCREHPRRLRNHKGAFSETDPTFPKNNYGQTKLEGEKDVSASILIPWGFIASIVHFPGTEGFDFPNPFDSQIGFK